MKSLIPSPKWCHVSTLLPWLQSWKNSGNFYLSCRSKRLSKMENNFEVFENFYTQYFVYFTYQDSFSWLDILRFLSGFAVCSYCKHLVPETHQLIIKDLIYMLTHTQNLNNYNHCYCIFNFRVYKWKGSKMSSNHLVALSH